MISTHTLDELMVQEEPLKIGIVEAETRISGSDQQRIFRLIREAYASKEYHVIISPEYSFMPRSRPLSEAELAEYLEKLKHLSDRTLLIPGTFVWKKEDRIQNSCYVFYNGEIIHQQDKIEDGGEGRFAVRHSLKYQPGETLSPFQWKDLKIGIEICADAGSLAQRRVLDLDIVFLVASGNPDLPRSMKAVHQKGYGVVADGLEQVYIAGNLAEVHKKFKNLFGGVYS